MPQVGETVSIGSIKRVAVGETVPMSQVGMKQGTPSVNPVTVLGNDAFYKLLHAGRTPEQIEQIAKMKSTGEPVTLGSGEELASSLRETTLGAALDVPYAGDVLAGAGQAGFLAKQAAQNLMGDTAGAKATAGQRAAFQESMREVNPGFAPQMVREVSAGLTTGAPAMLAAAGGAPLAAAGAGALAFGATEGSRAYTESGGDVPYTATQAALGAAGGAIPGAPLGSGVIKAALAGGAANASFGAADQVARWAFGVNPVDSLSESGKQLLIQAAIGAGLASPNAMRTSLGRAAALRALQDERKGRSALRNAIRQEAEAAEAQRNAAYQPDQYGNVYGMTEGGAGIPQTTTPVGGDLQPLPDAIPAPSIYDRLGSGAHGPDQIVGGAAFTPPTKHPNALGFGVTGGPDQIVGGAPAEPGTPYVPPRGMEGGGVVPGQRTEYTGEIDLISEMMGVRTRAAAAAEQAGATPEAAQALAAAAVEKGAPLTTSEAVKAAGKSREKIRPAMKAVNEELTKGGGSNEGQVQGRAQEVAPQAETPQAVASTDAATATPSAMQTPGGTSKAPAPVQPEAAPVAGKKPESLIKNPFQGLERASKGLWADAEGNEIHRVGKGEYRAARDGKYTSDAMTLEEARQHALDLETQRNDAAEVARMNSESAQPAPTYKDSLSVQPAPEAPQTPRGADTGNAGAGAADKGTLIPDGWVRTTPAPDSPELAKAKDLIDINKKNYQVYKDALAAADKARGTKKHDALSKRADKLFGKFRETDEAAKNARALMAKAHLETLLETGDPVQQLAARQKLGIDKGNFRQIRELIKQRADELGVPMTESEVLDSASMMSSYPSQRGMDDEIRLRAKVTGGNKVKSEAQSLVDAVKDVLPGNVYRDLSIDAGNTYEASEIPQFKERVDRIANRHRVRKEQAAAEQAKKAHDILWANAKNSMYIRTDEGFRRVEGTWLKGNTGGLELFAYGGGNDWSVTEASTGLALARGTTRLEAVANAKAKIKDAAKVNAAIAARIDAGETTPRYQAKQGNAPSGPDFSKGNTGAALNPAVALAELGKTLPPVWREWFDSWGGGPQAIGRAKESRRNTESGISYRAISNAATLHNIARRSGNKTPAGSIDALRGDAKALAAQTPEMQGALAQARQHIDELQQRFIDLLPADDKRIHYLKDSIGEWVNRSYAIFDLKHRSEKVKSKWLKSREDMPEFKAVVADRMRRKGISEAEAYNDVMDELRSYANDGDFIPEPGRMGKQNLGILKQRKDLSPEWRAIMGEVVDPAIAYERSVRKLANVIGGAEFQNSVVTEGKKGGWLIEADKAPKGWEMIAPESAENMGMLAGMRAKPEVARVLREGLKIQARKSDFARVIQTINQNIKWSQTVGKVPVSIFQQMPQNVLMVAQAGLNPFDIPTWGKAARAAAYHVKHGTRFGQSNAKQDAYLQRLAKQGVIDSEATIGSQEAAIHRAGAADETRFLRNPMQSQFGQTLSRAYMLADNTAKIYAFEKMHKLYRRQIKGMSQDQSDAFIAEKVKDFMPTYQRTPKIMDALQDVPLVQPYVNFVYQTARAQANVVRSMLDNGLRKDGDRIIAAKQLAGIIAANGLATYGLEEFSEWASGVTPEEEKSLRASAAPWSRDNPKAFGPKVGDQGDRYVFDLGYSAASPGLVIPLINAIAHGPKAGFKALYDAYAGFSPVIPPAMAVVTGRDIETGRELATPRAPFKDQVKARAAAVVQDIAPGIGTSIARGISAATGRPYKGRVDLSPMTEVPRTFGVPTERVQPLKELTYAARMWDDHWRPEYDKRIDAGVPKLRAVQEINALRKQEFEKVHERAVALKSQGLSSLDIRRELKKNGLSWEAAGRIVNGRYRTWKPAD